MPWCSGSNVSGYGWEAEWILVLQWVSNQTQQLHLLGSATFLFFQFVNPWTSLPGPSLSYEIQPLFTKLHNIFIPHERKTWLYKYYGWEILIYKCLHSEQQNTFFNILEHIFPGFKKTIGIFENRYKHAFIPIFYYVLQRLHQGIPIMVQWKWIWLGIMRLRVQSLASLSGLRIQNCH